MHWKVKAAIFRLLTVMPFGTQAHFALQRHVTRQWPRPATQLDKLLAGARRVHQATGEHQGTFLEIGAGRDLAVAIALRLMGSTHVTCVDVERLARLDLIAAAAAHMATRLGVSAPIIATWDDLERFGITYLAPTHLQNSGLADASFDCFFSIDTLEHIPTPDLRDVISEAKRLLRPGGHCVHAIDYSDHFARGDDNLSRFNFLTYSEEAWRSYNTRLQFVNRLRHSEFLAIFRESGFSVVRTEPDLVPPQPLVLEKLASEFRGFEIDDLFTLRALVVASA